MTNFNSHTARFQIWRLLKHCLLIIGFSFLASCGSNTADVAYNDLSTGVSPAMKSADFGKPASAAEIAAMAQKLSGYFNGQHASNPKALMGEQVNQSSTASFSPKVSPTNIAKPVFRFYNTKTEAHFFTMSPDERDYVINTFPFFTFEGNSFYAFPDPDPQLNPVYRFFNQVTGTHFFTISAAEKDHVIATWPAIYKFEGIAWYASPGVRTLWVPVYRFFNTKTGTHFYTTSAAERDHVIATWSWYSYEGIAYYVRKDATLNPPAVTPPIPVLNDTGITSSQCYQAGSSVLVSCTSAAAIALNSKQDGMVGRDITSPNSSDGKLGFSFSNVGNYPLTDCVKDNVTGLMWEGNPTTGFRVGFEFTNFGDERSNDASVYAAYVNDGAGLCGYTDWRMPSIDELMSLIDYSVPSYTSNLNPQIDTNWFPNMGYIDHWSSTPLVSSNGLKGFWIMSGGRAIQSESEGTFNTALLRLVRKAQ
jgi:Protein of unknown function (DUF1566)/Repeat of unknown function (DUF5648)